MLALPSKPTKKIKIARGPVSLSAPVVIGDSVFVGHEEGEILRLNWPHVDAAWRLPAEGYAPHAAVGEIVLLRSQREGHLRGLRITGEIVWTLAERGWFAVGRDLYCQNQGILQANVSTGAVVGRFDVPGPPFHFQGVCDGVFLLGTNLKGPSDPIRAFDMERHEIVWERKLREEILTAAHGIEDKRTAYFTSHCGSEGRVVFYCGKSLFGFALRENRMLWQRNFNVACSRPVMHKGRVYFWAFALDDNPPDETRLVCLDEATGETVYDRHLAAYGGDFVFRQWAGPGHIEGECIAFATVRSSTGLLTLFRISDGELVWSFTYKAATSEPVLSGQRLLVTAHDGNMLVFEGDAAKPLRKQPLDVRGPGRTGAEIDYRVEAALLTETEGDALAEVVLEPLWEELPDDEWMDAKDLLDRATEGQRRLVAVYQFLNLTMYTEGLEGFFRSGSAPLANLVPDAFEVVGLPEYAYQCRRLLALFPGRRVPEDPDVCAEVLDTIPDAERRRLFEDVGGTLSDLMAARPFEGFCSAYVRAKPEEFVRMQRGGRHG